MYTYLSGRYAQVAANGVRKGVVAVKRLKALTDEQRRTFAQQYASIIGRNVYSQNLREYCYVAYKGKFYSDCSSSGIKTFEKCGHKFPWTLNTAGIYTSDLFESVNVTISNGHIINPEVLKVGDCILFAGSDPSRPLQIGHVEYVYSTPAQAKAAASEKTDSYPRWVQVGDDWYYRIAPSQNAHGWMKIAETGAPQNVHWYYFDDKGLMQSDWFEVDKKWYYAQPKGSLKGALYTTDAKGAQSIWYV